MERWVPAFGFEGLYEVSSAGLVKRVSKAMGTSPGKLLKPWNTNGYKTLSLRKGGRYFGVYVHRLVLQSFTDKHGEQTNHVNGIKDDNRIENLEWCTASENLTHACRVLGKRRGSNHWKSKITESEVRKIRTLYKDGESVMDITRKYPLSHATISRILSGRIWRHKI